MHTNQNDIIKVIEMPATLGSRLAGHWSNGHFIATLLNPGWTNTAKFLFVNLYFYILIQPDSYRGFRAGRAMNSSPARWAQIIRVIFYNLNEIKTFFPSTHPSFGEI